MMFRKPNFKQYRERETFVLQPTFRAAAEDLQRIFTTFDSENSEQQQKFFKEIYNI